MDPKIWDRVANADPAVRRTIEKTLCLNPILPLLPLPLPALAHPCQRASTHARPRLGTDRFFFFLIWHRGRVLVFYFVVHLSVLGEKSWSAT